MKQIIPFNKEIIFKTMISKITSISLEHTLEVKEKDTISGDFIVSGSYKMTEASQIDEEFSYKVPIEITIDDKYDTSGVILDIDDFVYEVIDEEKLLLKIDLCIDNLELLPQEEDIQEERSGDSELIEDVMVDNDKEEVISSYDDGLLEEEVCDSSDPRCIDEKEIEDLFLDVSKKEKLEIPSNESVSSNNNNNKDNEEENNNYNSTNTFEPKDNSTNEVISNYQNMINSNTTANNNQQNLDNQPNNVASIFSAFKNTDETFSTYCIYIIREGDDLDTVLNKYKTTRDVLAEYNDLSDIRIGSKIIVPSTNE